MSWGILHGDGVSLRRGGGGKKVIKLRSSEQISVRITQLHKTLRHSSSWTLWRGKERNNQKNWTGGKTRWRRGIREACHWHEGEARLRSRRRILIAEPCYATGVTWQRTNLSRRFFHSDTTISNRKMEANSLVSLRHFSILKGLVKRHFPRKRQIDSSIFANPTNIIKYNVFDYPCRSAVPRVTRARREQQQYDKYVYRKLK